MLQQKQRTEGPTTETEIHILSFSSDARAAMTLRQLYEDRYEPEETRTEGTRVQYCNALNHLRTANGGLDPRLCDLSKGLLKRCVTEMQRKPKKDEKKRVASPATANKVLRHLLSLWSYATDEDLADDVPRSKRLKVREPKRVPQAWKVAQIAKLLSAAKEIPGTIEGISAAKWWTALILVLYDTGLRIGAVMLLKWMHLDEDAGAILALAETQKQNADQIPALSVDCLNALRAIRGDRPLIFSWPYDANCEQWPTLTRHLRKKILTPAGLPQGRRDLFQKIRRTNASYIKAGGGNATEQLGHSSASVTKVYIDPIIAQPKRQVDLLPRPVRKPDDPQLRLF